MALLKGVYVEIVSTASQPKSAMGFRGNAGVRVGSGFQPRVAARSGRCWSTGFGLAQSRKVVINNESRELARRVAQFSFMGRKKRPA